MGRVTSASFRLCVRAPRTTRCVVEVATSDMKPPSEVPGDDPKPLMVAEKWCELKGRLRRDVQGVVERLGGVPPPGEADRDLEPAISQRTDGHRVRARVEMLQALASVPEPDAL